MSLVTEAHRLHKAGYDLIPLTGKRPQAKNWTKAPRLAWEQMKPALERGSNVGIRLGHELEDGRFLACLDVDIVGKLTDEEQEDVNNLIGALDAPTAVTGFGNASAHLYVATESPAKTRKLGQAERLVEYVKDGKTKTGPVWVVELRGLGAQTVLPPSVHPDTQTIYKWQRGRKLNGARSLPQLSLEASSSLSSSSSSSSPSLSLDDLTIAPLYKQLLRTGDSADYPSRSEALYAVISACVRSTDLTDAEIEQLILGYPLGDKAREGRPVGWIATQCQKLRKQGSGLIAALKRLQAPVTTAQLKPIFEAASRRGMSPMERDEFLSCAKEVSGISKGALAEELDSSIGDASAQRARLAHGDPIYEEVIKRHALVSWAGKPAVFRQRIDPPSWESRYDVMTLSALATFYENKPVLMGKSAANPVEMWRADPQRAEYLEGARLIPDGEDCPKGVFNLWTGFAYSPKRGPVDIWRNFVLKVICDSSKAHAQWLEDWIADMFQNPGHPPGVAIVMRGGEGIGKGTFASALGAIVGSHFRHITQESQLTGRFNAHFADSTLIFADELVWGGDKKHRGALYALVTERYTMVERKNFDTIPMRNLNRLITASNNDWVVPTGMDGRRWFVLDVSDAYKGDTAFFETVRRFLHNGGYEAVLDYYLNRPITHDLRKAPITRALVDQKIAGFDSITAWWNSVLDRGCIRPVVGDATSAWDTTISKELVRLSYKSFCEDHGVKPMYWGTVVKRWQKLVPSLKEVRIRDGEQRVQTMTLPPHEECVEFFNELLGLHEVTLI